MLNAIKSKGRRSLVMNGRGSPGGRINTTDNESPDDEGDLDPRIQGELNILNQTSADINKLENELDEARCNYKITFTEASQRLAQAAEKRRKQIQRARAYFELKEEAKKAQGESLKAARQYQSAISVYRAAKETVTLAEERLLQNGEGNLSAAWQEMMNHATMRVMDAEKEKRESEERHQFATTKCANCEKKLKQLEKKFSKSIQRAGPYFEVKQQLDLKLQHQKQNVTDLQSAIKDTKGKYSNALRNLEKISEEIHQSRRDKIMLMFPRQPGVGAESGSSLSSMVPDFSFEELDSVSEISDSAVEDDGPGDKDDGISFNCAIVSNCDDDMNGSNTALNFGSDAILDSRSLNNHKTESVSQTFDKYTENNQTCTKDLSLQNADELATRNLYQNANEVSSENTDDSTPTRTDVLVLKTSDKLALENRDKSMEGVGNNDVMENTQGLPAGNIDESVLNNVENLTLKNIDDSANDKDESVNDIDESANDKDKTVSDKDESVNDIDESANDKDKTVSDKDKSVSDKDKTVSDKDESVNDIDESVNDKDKTVSDKDESVDDKDESANDKDKTLSDKDESVSDKDESVNDKDKTVNDIDEFAKRKTTEHIESS